VNDPSSTRSRNSSLADLINNRFGGSHDPALPETDPSLLVSMLERGSCRDFLDKPVAPEIVETLCAVALAAPTKSDLQQRDIILLNAPDQRGKLANLVSGQAWVAQAPTLLVFCGNNRRQRLMHEWHDVRFANDHLDAFFNAVADAAIALGAFVTAAEAVGLGCCPISAVRNEASAVAKLLDLPPHVFPLAGLAVGHPKSAPKQSMRLPLEVTVHTDRYSETELQVQVARYDTARAAAQPYGSQRLVGTFGKSTEYGWSEDKVRQYSEPERADFGAFVRAQGFKLD
jgi:nitroreductase/FMN reductase [NAD(P)H]